MVPMKYILVVSVLVLASCVNVGKSVDNVCSESSHLECLSEVHCDLDEERGCQVCQCGPAKDDTGNPSDYQTGGYDDVEGGP